MKKIKILILCAAFISFFGINNLWGFEKIPTDQLLAEYLKNDNNIKNLTIAVQKEILSQNKKDIENGFDIELSTGELNLSFNEGGTDISVSPSVTASLPQYNNLQIKLSTKIENKSESENNELLSDSSLKLSADLISSAGKEREITALEADRKILEAKRNLQNKVLSVEKTFYQDLKNLITSTKSIISQEQSLYTDRQDFELVKAKGYSSASSDYKLAEMKVLSDLHEIESKKHTLIHDYVVFYKKCGFDIQLEMNMDFMELLPTDIQETIALNIQDFDKATFTEIEKAEWTNKINTMERQLKTDFSLGANAGFTYKNSTTGGTPSADAGISGSYKGVKAAAGLSYPLNFDSSSRKGPVLSLSASVNPNSFKKDKIDDYVQELTAEQELLEIETAYMNYDNQVVSYTQKLEDLQWERTTNEENLKMYQKLEKEMWDWFNQGIISETKYLSAKTQMQLYGVQQLINKIEFIVYNNEIKSLFVE